LVLRIFDEALAHIEVTYVEFDETDEQGIRRE
jgi:hypothetical protein